MAKAKGVSGTTKKAAARRTKKAPAEKIPARPAPEGTGVVKKPRPRVSKNPSLAPAAPAERSISDAQSKVMASKFASVDRGAPRPVARPTLPASYGESHLLLLVRDPQTLFAAWDIAPATLDALKDRLGRRGFAVSTLTLRLSRAGGGTSVVHVANKARSRYLKIEGGPSFLAEIGFTTPAGRFELVARSAPCFVPMGPLALHESAGSGRRAVLGYREARALIRRGGLSRNPASAARARASAAKAGGASFPVAPAPRTIGGASDLYRR